jgi:site-specific DNA-methyltransferase (adenine-specific)
MKPVALVGRFMRNSSRRGQIVADFFGGSGTTMIAAESLGRKARLMELDPHYCDVIRKRWAEFTHGEGCDWQALTPCAANSPRS